MRTLVTKAFAILFSSSFFFFNCYSFGNLIIIIERGTYEVIKQKGSFTINQLKAVDDDGSTVAK